MVTFSSLIVGIAVVEHALGDDGGGMFVVCEDADFRGSFDEGAVECGPRAACKRYDAHIVIRHHQSVGQHLQGVEGGVDHDLCLGHLALDRVGKAEEQGVATGENGNRLTIDH